MSTYIIMSAIILLLILELVIGAKYKPESDHFFDLENTNAMRGFWCLIVILVHIPVAYQNPIQDMIGSFAYIGVTFFFLTSAYGLSLAQKKNPNSINSFWRRRLPKLLIPCLVVNVVGLFFNAIVGGSIELSNLIRINGWVQWLLVCYLIFWICHKFIGRDQGILTCALVMMFSLTTYFLRGMGYISRATWCPELYGFIWGILVFHFRDKIIQFCKTKYVEKCIMLCITAMILGVTYLKMKTVVFFGDYLLKIALGIAIISFILLLNTKISICNKISRFLGRISFEVYLLHSMVFVILAFFFPSIRSGLFILSSICITVSVSWIVHIISNKLIQAFKLLINC